MGIFENFVLSLVFYETEKFCGRGTGKNGKTDRKNGEWAKNITVLLRDRSSRLHGNPVSY